MRIRINNHVRTTTRASRPRLLLAAASALVAATLGLGACASDTPAASTPVSGAALQTPASGATLDAASFAAASALPGTVVLDVRTPEEFASGHLKGAVNLDVESASFDAQLAALNKAVPYAVYCRSGNRSGVALQKMQAAGFTTAYHLGGGIGAWQEAGLGVVTGS